jgi:hypothetical protein
MLAYQLIEDRDVSVKQADGESAMAALRNGARPPLSERSGKWRPLFDALWRDRDQPCTLATVCQFFEDSRNWIDGVDAKAFGYYKGYLDFEERSMNVCDHPALNKRLLVRGRGTDAAKRGKTMLDKITRVLVWLNGAGKGSLSETQLAKSLLQILQSDGRLTPARVQVISPSPRAPSLFDISGFTANTREGRIDGGTYGNPVIVDCQGRSFILKTVTVGDRPDPAAIAPFFRALIGGSLGHPALLRVAAWNASAVKSNWQLSLLAERPAQGSLKSALLQFIILYGVARALTFFCTHTRSPTKLCSQPTFCWTRCSTRSCATLGKRRRPMARTARLSWHAAELQRLLPMFMPSECDAPSPCSRRFANS